MMKLTEPEHSILEVLWNDHPLSLGQITEALQGVQGWSRNTVHTYLTRMAAKGLVSIEKGAQKPYAPAVCREDWARERREDLLREVYGGAAGDLIAAFLKESALSPKEALRLKKLLEEMEV